MPSLTAPRSLFSRRRNARRPIFELLEPRGLMTAGALDASFCGGCAIVYPSGSSNGVPQVAVEPWDDRIITTDGTSSGALGVYRYNINGTIDASIGVEGMATVDVGANPSPVAIVTNPTTEQLYIIGDTPVKMH
jgi:hypothetical protein